MRIYQDLETFNTATQLIAFYTANKRRCAEKKKCSYKYIVIAMNLS